MIKMTKIAAEKFKTIVNQKELPETTSLRVDLQHAGDSPGGARLVLGLDAQGPRGDDKVSTTDGAQLVVGASVAEELGNGELDYREDEGSFVFQHVD